MLELIQTDVKTALDVGCGEGNFGKLIKKKFDAEVWGFEPVPRAYEVAKENLDKVLNSIFLPDSVPDNKFDLISFNDVLEHMTEPGEVLRQCLTKLTARGQVIASIPNILYFHDFFTMVFKKDWKYEPAGIFDKTHLRFFTRKSIVRLFDEAGYEIIKIEGIRPTDSKKFLLFNVATVGNWEEMRYLQFAVCAKPK